MGMLGMLLNGIHWFYPLFHGFIKAALKHHNTHQGNKCYNKNIFKSNNHYL